jgi:hypothetical protein
MGKVISIYTDPEEENRKQIVFSIDVNESLEEIIELEDVFYAKFVENISRKKRRYFVLQCHKHETN